MVVDVTPSLPVIDYSPIQPDQPPHISTHPAISPTTFNPPQILPPHDLAIQNPPLTLTLEPQDDPHVSRTVHPVCETSSLIGAPTNRTTPRSASFFDEELDEEIDVGTAPSSPAKFTSVPASPLLQSTSLSSPLWHTSFDPLPQSFAFL